MLIQRSKQGYDLKWFRLTISYPFYQIIEVLGPLDFTYNQKNMSVFESVKNHCLKPILIDQIIILRSSNELRLDQKVQFLH